MKKEFTKADLRNGMVVEYKDGNKQIYVNGYLLGLNRHHNLKGYSSDLLWKGEDSTLSIHAVYEIVEQLRLEDILEEGRGLKKIWERKPEVIVKYLKPGDSFKFKGFEWIVLDNNVDGGVLAIMTSTWNGKEYWFDDDGCNNYAKSSLRRKLLNELLPALGEDNLIPHKVDLIADNGDDRYGTVTDKVFILSCDEYRKYRKNVPLLPEWMWTCTPWYITGSGYGYHVRGVSADGILGYDSAYGSGGVAPVCVFKKDVVAEEVNKDD